MREVLGPPLSVAGAILTPTIWTALFQYPGFHVTYESGIINVPEFDAHIEVYSLDKVVRVQYDTPYVRGLPVTMTVKEKVGDGGFQERKVRKTYQDPYTEEMLAFWECVVEETVPKTSVQDVRGDVEIFGMVLRAGVGSLGE
jgi:predicted dehydrogenase